MTITIYGAFRTDTTMTDNTATYATTGATFQISSYSTLTMEDGADGTVIAGDSITNESPNDPTQTFAGNAISWDYTIEVTDGTNTYEIGVVDYDINGSGNFTYPTAEQGYFLAFVGDIPPLNTTLTIGSITNNSPSIDVDTIVPCFTRGTQIETENGLKAVEGLRAGDRIQTLDNGLQTLCWVGSACVSSTQLSNNSKLKPILITAGALGRNLPERDLSVSPQHRMMVKSKIAQRMFGVQEVLIPANKLVGLPGIEIDETAQEVEYFHLLFDRHEIVFAEGAPTESLYTGPEAIKSLSADARAEIFELFPDIETTTQKVASARIIPARGKQMKRLVARHHRNAKPLLEYT